VPSDRSVPSATARRQRFLRVATRRTKQVLQDLQRLARCANRSGYDYNPNDTAKIFDAIDKQLETVRAQFRSPKERKEVEFKLE